MYTLEFLVEYKQKLLESQKSKSSSNIPNKLFNTNKEKNNNSIEEHIKNINGLLNKCSKSNYKQIKLDLENKINNKSFEYSDDMIDKIVHKFHEKCIYEESFSSLYSSLLRDLIIKNDKHKFTYHFFKIVRNHAMLHNNTINVLLLMKLIIYQNRYELENKSITQIPNMLNHLLEMKRIEEICYILNYLNRDSKVNNTKTISNEILQEYYLKYKNLLQLNMCEYEMRIQFMIEDL